MFKLTLGKIGGFVMVHMKGQGAIESLAATARPMRAQGATEYLVLLAVVLIIALVSIALLGFFPGLASDARITQSTSYWRGEARPFAILEHTASTTGNISILLQNNDATGTFTINSLGVSNASNSTATSFAPGESKVINVYGLPSGTAGTVYDLNVTIGLTTPGGVSSKQYGAKNLVGKYV
jgi:hypothetical protein